MTPTLAAIAPDLPLPCSQCAWLLGTDENGKQVIPDHNEPLGRCPKAERLEEMVIEALRVVYHTDLCCEHVCPECLERGRSLPWSTFTDWCGSDGPKICPEHDGSLEVDELDRWRNVPAR